MRLATAYYSGRKVDIGLLPCSILNIWFYAVVALSLPLYTDLSISSIELTSTNVIVPLTTPCAIWSYALDIRHITT